LNSKTLHDLQVQDNPHFLSKVITGDKIWVYT